MALDERVRIAIQEAGDAADWNDLYTKHQELRRPVDAEYRAAVGPIIRRRSEDRARVDREYAEKVRAAKSKLAAAQREARETLAVLRRWRDATTAAIDREAVNAKAPYLDERHRLLAPIEAWDVAQRERLKEKTKSEITGA